MIVTPSHHHRGNGALRWSLPPRIALLVSAVLLVVGLGWSVWRVGSAQVVLQQAERRQVTAQHDLTRLVREQGRQASVVVERIPEADLVARIQQALVTAGLPPERCGGVQPLADQRDQATGLRTRAVNVILRDLHPSDLGSWLGAWLVPGQPWRVNGLTLAHQVTSSDGPSLDPDRYTITVTLVIHALETAP